MRVASLADAWIEIRRCCAVLLNISIVASLADAWIEIFVPGYRGIYV